METQSTERKAYATPAGPLVCDVCSREVLCGTGLGLSPEQYRVAYHKLFRNYWQRRVRFEGVTPHALLVLDEMAQCDRTDWLLCDHCGALAIGILGT